MRKILFFSHLRTQSGHHQAAEALMDLVERRMGRVETKKTDLLTETSPVIERFISVSYMKWIRSFPGIYDRAYNSWFCHGPDSDENRFKWYQPFLINKMRDILEREQPDLIFCAHSLPSLILSKMKLKGQCRVPVINIYTDLFVNCVWGRKGIDVHLLPTAESKNQLIKDGLDPGRLRVTGIPVHSAFIQMPEQTESHLHHPLRAVIAGGNTGLGNIDRLREELERTPNIHFTVLCGNNRRLLGRVKSWELPNVTAMPFIASREEMNELYEQADLLITKPGGITISEGLRKKLPMFIHSSLPGQERYNLDYLTAKGLAFPLDINGPIEQQLMAVLENPFRMHRWKRSVDRYHGQLDIRSESELAVYLEELLSAAEKDRGRAIHVSSFSTAGK